MVLKAADHIKRNLSAPSKFAPSWEGPYLIREASASGYYNLATTEAESLTEPINGKWLKLHYAHLSSMYQVTLFCMVLSYFYYANKELSIAFCLKYELLIFTSSLILLSMHTHIYSKL